MVDTLVVIGEHSSGKAVRTIVPIAERRKAREPFGMSLLANTFDP